MAPSSTRTLPRAMASPYLVPVAALLRDVPSSISVDFDAPFDEAHEFDPRGPAETDVFGEAPVHVTLRLESFSGGIRARGRVRAPWHGVCRRCSAPVLGLSDVSVNERFVEHPDRERRTQLSDREQLHRPGPPRARRDLFGPTARPTVSARLRGTVPALWDRSQ